MRVSFVISWEGSAMDFATILPAVISAAVTLAVCLVNNHYQVSKTNALISYRLEQLEKKVDKHNNLVERTYRLEEKTALHEDEINRHKERIRILENDGR